MDYKKIITSQKTRMAILNTMSFIPDQVMIRLQYWIKLKRRLRLKNPERYTEKLQWYKLYYRNPLMTVCADKYNVREYIKEIGYGELLTKLYGVYNTPEEIELESLPSSFIIKTTNGSGTNIVCREKSQLNWEVVVAKLKEYMARPNISPGREWAYYDVKNLIVIEELLVDTDNPYGGINDYKFMCFSGKVNCIVVDVGRFTDHKRNFYTTDWERINAISDHPNFEPDIPRPKNLDYMIQIAKELSEPFPHVRVDLYNINEHIYFGELTFYPWSGYVQYSPDSFDYDLGAVFVLPDKFEHGGEY